MCITTHPTVCSVCSRRLRCSKPTKSHQPSQPTTFGVGRGPYCPDHTPCHFIERRKIPLRTVRTFRASTIPATRNQRAIAFNTTAANETDWLLSPNQRDDNLGRCRMATEGYMLNGGLSQMPYRNPNSHTISPMNQNNNTFESDTSNSGLAMGSERGTSADATADLLIRKLPRHTTGESLRTMLLFAKEFLGVDFVDFPHDQGYFTALARFRTFAAAEEVKTHLHGKQNNPNEPPLLVEIIRHSPTTGPRSRRNNPDLAFNRNNSSSSTSSSSGQLRQASRFNSTFQAMDRLSSPNGASNFATAAPISPAEGPDLVSPLSSFFPPQSPLAQAKGDRQRVSGKAVIREDGVDDEPGDLLKDPVAYAKNDSSNQLPRHPTNPQLPLSRFANLSLSTSTATTPSMPGFTSPRDATSMQSPTSTMSPMSLGGQGPNASYQMASQHHQRHNYPPVNPADQNPPCNTLYVGNLPIDTSEDELKTLFSKQRGYKRLCFRTKQNGPMCFVEFEDVSFATKALNDLYGYPLHNSVKGGIRLSFSKNPLGVRSGQPGGMGPPTPHSPSGPPPGINGLGITPFATANGPPPGLAAPPGLNSQVGSMNGMISSPGLGGMGMGVGMAGMTTGWGGARGQYSDYMYGR